MTIGKSFRRMAIAVFTAAFCLVSLPGNFVPGNGSAVAQEKPQNLFEFLRRNKQRNAAPERRAAPPKQIRKKKVVKKKKATRKSSKKRTSNKKRTSKKRAPSRKKTSVARQVAPPPAPEPAVEKLENAKTILVVGDFLAGGLAKGLEDAFQDAPGVVVISQTNGSSGLVRDDFYDWPGSLPGFIEETDPAIVAVMIGSNDRQPLAVDGRSLNVRTDAWNAEYSSRVEEIVQAVKAKNIPLVWVGTPSFKSSNMTRDMLAFNEIYRRATENAKGDFVDIWEGFVDEGGNFIYNGSDINGQTVQLRGQDGINLSDAGTRKVAFYAEKPIRRLLGDAASTDIIALQSDNLSSMSLPPIGLSAMTDRTEPISLSDPSLDGGKSLMGASGEALAPSILAERSPRDLLVLEGKPAAAPAGRANYFSLVQPAAAAPAAAESDDPIVQIIQNSEKQPRN